ncbi:MAG: hypothetical protein ACKOBD_03585 [Chloroflexota bacterium]|jgi:hypothetical protein
MLDEREKLVNGVLLKWERWRILYNVLLVLSLLIRQVPQWIWIDTLIFGNLFYFLGPVVEGYAEWIGKQSKWYLPVMFTAGATASVYTVLFIY